MATRGIVLSINYHDGLPEGKLRLSDPSGKKLDLEEQKYTHVPDLPYFLMAYSFTHKNGKLSKFEVTPKNSSGPRVAFDEIVFVPPIPTNTRVDLVVTYDANGKLSVDATNKAYLALTPSFLPVQKNNSRDERSSKYTVHYTRLIRLRRGETIPLKRRKMELES